MKKEKISDKQFLLIIDGPSCGGKSEAAKAITDRYGGIYNGKNDVIKRFISDYEPNVHRGVAHEMTLATIRIALSRGLSALKEGALFEPEKLIELAKEAGVPFFVANVEAPAEVLEARFWKKVEDVKKGIKVASINPKRFKELNETYYATKMESPLEFDSSKQSPEEIAGAIVKYLREKLKD